MAAQYTQRPAVVNAFTSAPSNTFDSDVSDGSTIVVCMWGGETTYTSFTDSEGNTYTKQCSTTSGSGTRFEIWTAFDVVGGSSFTVTGSAASSFYDIAIFEYPASLAASLRVANTSQFPGGSPILPQTTLTGTVSGDLVIGMAYSSGISLVGESGTFGANAPTSTTDDSGSGPDTWLVTEGNSDGSSPMTVSFGSATNDWYGAAAIAFVPGSATEESPPALFMGNVNLLF